MATQTSLLALLLRAAILLDAWSQTDVQQQAGWLGLLLVIAMLQQATKLGPKEHDLLMLAITQME